MIVNMIVVIMMSKVINSHDECLLLFQLSAVPELVSSSGSSKISKRIAITYDGRTDALSSSSSFKIIIINRVH